MPPAAAQVRADLLMEANRPEEDTTLSHRSRLEAARIRFFSGTEVSPPTTATRAVNPFAENKTLGVLNAPRSSPIGLLQVVVVLACCLGVLPCSSHAAENATHQEVNRLEYNGLQAIGRGDWSEGLGMLLKVIEADPKGPTRRLNYGSALFVVADKLLAQEEKKALRLAKDSERQLEECVLLAHRQSFDNPLVVAHCLYLVAEIQSHFLEDSGRARVFYKAAVQVEPQHSLAESRLLALPPGRPKSDKATRFGVGPRSMPDYQAALRLIAREVWLFDFDEQRWTIGNRGRDEWQLLVEYVPLGQTVGNWKEIVSTSLFFGDYDQDRLEETTRRARDGFEKRCPLGEWATLKETGTTILYEWRQTGCKGRPSYHRLGRLTIGSKGLHTIGYERIVPKLDSGLRQAWIQRLMAARLLSVQE